MSDFFIDEQYLVSVNKRDHISYSFNNELISGISYYSLDHPEFTKLREQLGEEGYIEIQRSWWNGDRVLKPFTLNGHSFEIGMPFFCASALGNQQMTCKNMMNKS